jgi:DNA gyrase inhibitor GyrI
VQTRHAYLVVFKEWKASSKLWPRSKFWSLYRARLPTDPDEAKLTCRIKHALVAL